ncbi:MAG: ABC transporter permease [Liquorilactobacillus ghanensis]|uniref:ABC transporter permease n=1 Tax=Liquorilactobacillus ghanensis TaxID=399370 RepID=UPI0039E9DA35
MFLALKEIKHEKLRYGLIIGMIMLISYLVFVLTGLSQGLAQQNTAAIKSWNAKQIVLNKNANVNLTQSLITQKASQQLKLTATEAYVGQASVVAKKNGLAKESAQFIGLESNQFIAQHLQLTSGHWAKNQQQLVVNQSFKTAGYKLGDHLKLNSSKTNYQIVGFTKNATLSIAPVIYGQLATWQQLKNLNNSFKTSAIVSQKANYQTSASDLKAYPIKTFINKLPGYSAQNLTFTFMIAFLMVISLIVIAVFLYILTIQKIQNYAVLRAQGVPAQFLIRATLAQAFLLVLVGIIIAAGLTVLTSLIIPAGTPMTFNLSLLSGIAGGLVLMALFGALIPIWTITKIDPITAIGG